MIFPSFYVLLADTTTIITVAKCGIITAAQQLSNGLTEEKPAASTNVD